jgi:hypothetical protein
MKISVLISLGEFNNIKFQSSEFKDIQDCLKEIIQHLSKINDYHVDSYIQSYLVPMFYDEPKSIKWYKRIKKRRDILRKLRVKRENMFYEVRGLEQDKYELNYEINKLKREYNKTKKKIEELT